jgi:DHA3 family macrolide efflux protein-like MFS transporter
VSATAAGPAVPLSLRDILKISGFKRLWLARLVSILGDFLAVFGVINLITFKWHGTPLQVTNVMIAFIYSPGHRRTTSRRIRRSLEREADDDHQRSDPSGADSGLGFCYSTGTNIRTVLPREHRIELLWPVAIRNVAHTSPGERADVSECADVSGVLHDAYHCSGGGGFAGVLAWVQFVLLSGQRQLFFSAAMLSTIAIVRMVNAKDATEKTVRSLRKDYTAGSRFILTHPAISFVMIAMMTAMFVLSCFSPLISVYVRDQLHAGTRAFGIISAMVGVGLILGTQVVNAVAKGFSKKYVALSGLFGLSFATFVLALFQTPWLAGVSMFGIGLAIAFIVVPAQTLIQRETPHDMLGRVSSSFMAVFSLSQLLGLLLSRRIGQFDRSAAFVHFQPCAACGVVWDWLFAAA